MKSCPDIQKGKTRILYPQEHCQVTGVIQTKRALSKAQAKRNTAKEHVRVKSLIYNRPKKTIFFSIPLCATSRS